MGDTLQKMAPKDNCSFQNEGRKKKKQTGSEIIKELRSMCFLSSIYQMFVESVLFLGTILWKDWRTRQILSHLFVPLTLDEKHKWMISSNNKYYAQNKIRPSDSKGID